MPSSSTTPNPSTITLLNANAANHILALTTSTVTRKKSSSSYICTVISTWKQTHLLEKIISPNICKATIISTTRGRKMILPSRSSAIGPTIPLILGPRVNTLATFVTSTTILSFCALYKLVWGLTIRAI